MGGWVNAICNKLLHRWDLKSSRFWRTKHWFQDNAPRYILYILELFDSKCSIRIQIFAFLGSFTLSYFDKELLNWISHDKRGIREHGGSSRTRLEKKNGYHLCIFLFRVNVSYRLLKSYSNGYGVKNKWKKLQRFVIYSLFSTW